MFSLWTVLFLNFARGRPKLVLRVHVCLCWVSWAWRVRTHKEGAAQHRVTLFQHTLCITLPPSMLSLKLKTYRQAVIYKSACARACVCVGVCGLGAGVYASVKGQKRSEKGVCSVASQRYSWLEPPRKPTEVSSLCMKSCNMSTTNLHATSLAKETTCSKQRSSRSCTILARCRLWLQYLEWHQRLTWSTDEH